MAIPNEKQQHETSKKKSGTHAEEGATPAPWRIGLGDVEVSSTVFPNFTWHEEGMGLDIEK